MNSSNGKRTPPQAPDKETSATDTASSKQRRIGRVVHDERGAATVEWRNAPDDLERPVLELEGTTPRGKSKVSIADTFNPYERNPDATGVHKKTGGAKRDLKKLSEWMKQMKALQDRKKKGD